MAKDTFKLDDEDTYWRRVVRLFHMMDLRTAFVTDEEIGRQMDIIRRHREEDEVFDEVTLQRAYKIKNAVIHPDTGEKVVLPLRISFIIPANLVLDLGMISAYSPATTIAAQKQMQKSLWYAPYIRRLAPFGAVAVADVLNLSLMRQSEYLSGVDVYDSESGEHVGVSKRAGAFAVASCIFGRVVAAAPILILPPFILQHLQHVPADATRTATPPQKTASSNATGSSTCKNGASVHAETGVGATPKTRGANVKLPPSSSSSASLPSSLSSVSKKMPLLHRHPWLATPLLMLMIGTAIQVAVPFTFGMFRQTAKVDVSWLEPAFRGLHRDDGTPVTKVLYNKGL